MKAIILLFMLLIFKAVMSQYTTINLSNVGTNNTVLPIKNKHLLVISQDTNGITTFSLRDTLDNELWTKKDTLLASDLSFIGSSHIFPDLAHFLINTRTSYEHGNNVDSVTIRNYVFDSIANKVGEVSRTYHVPDDTLIPYFSYVVSNTPSTWSSILNVPAEGGKTHVIQYNLNGDTLSDMEVGNSQYFRTVLPCGVIRGLDGGLLFSLAYDNYLYMGRVKVDNIVDSNFHTSYMLSGSWPFMDNPIRFENDKYLFVYNYDFGRYVLFKLDTAGLPIPFSGSGEQLLKYNQKPLNNIYGLKSDSNYVYLLTDYYDGLINHKNAVILCVFDHSLNLLCQYKFNESPENFIKTMAFWNRNYAIFKSGTTGLKLIPLQGCSTFLGISEESWKDAIEIFPNPTKDKLYVKGIESLPEEAQLKIYNLFGQEMVSPKTENPIDITGLAKGVYLMKITSPSREYTKRFVVE